MHQPHFWSNLSDFAPISNCSWEEKWIEWENGKKSLKRVMISVNSSLSSVVIPHSHHFSFFSNSLNSFQWWPLRFSHSYVACQCLCVHLPRLICFVAHNLNIDLSARSTKSSQHAIAIIARIDVSLDICSAQEIGPKAKINKSQLTSIAVDCWKIVKWREHTLGNLGKWHVLSHIVVSIGCCCYC